MSKSEIVLLGTPRITKDGQISPLTQSPKGCALLTYLVVNGQSHSREAIADLLWDATSTTQSLRNLRALLVRIRPWLPELQPTRTTLTFTPSPTRPVDLLTLHAALQSDDVAILDAGLSLYQGDLLAGVYLPDAPRFHEWLVVIQERLRRQVFTTYERVCATYAAQEQWSQGIAAARRWLALNDLDERAHRSLMTQLAGQGQLDDALHQYTVCCERLWQELEVEPETATVLLANQLAAARAEQQQERSAVHTHVNEWPEPDELAAPGALPLHSMLPFHRNHHFTGRSAVLLQLAKMLLPWSAAAPDDQRRAVAITGMAGLGKTQLAVEFAHRYGRFFPGGVFWLNFGEADNVMEAVGEIGSERGLGLFREQEQLTLTDQVGRVQKAWQAAVPRLLIFDNCEDVQLLAKWLPVTGGSRILVTSRRAHWPRELNVQVAALGLMDRTESSALLQQLCHTLEAEEAAAIAAELGDLPLALHLAGGFLCQYASVQPTTYLTQLRDRGLLQHPSLRGRGTTHSPTDHELDVARTFALNLAQLDPADAVDQMAQRLLCHVACFAPGEPVSQALLRSTAVTATPTTAPGDEPQRVHDRDDLLTSLLAEDGLQRLVMLGLLKAEGHDAVVLHRLLATFIQETMDTELEHRSLLQNAQTQVGERIVQFLMEHERSSHLTKLPISTAHLRHLTERALASQDAPAVALAIFLGRYLTSMGNFGEAETYLQQALQVAKGRDDPLTHVQTLIALATLQESMGQVQESLDGAEAAVQLANETNLTDPVILTEAFYHIGWAHFRMGNVTPALQAAEKGYSISQTAEFVRGMARHLNLMGVVNYYLLGDFARASDQLQESLSLYRELNLHNSQAAALNNLGECAQLQGEFLLASTYYEEAITLANATGNYIRERIFISNWCGAQVELGNYSLAAARLDTLIAHASSSWYGLSEAYRFLAEAALGVGQRERALKAAQNALSSAHVDNDLEHGRAWCTLGRVTRCLDMPIAGPDGHSYDATACFRRSVTFFEESHLARDRAIVLAYWAAHERLQGNQEMGAILWQQATTIFIQRNLPLLMTALQERLCLERAINPEPAG